MTNEKVTNYHFFTYVFRDVIYVKNPEVIPGFFSTPDIKKY